jgi:hypothetical protein
MTNPLLMSLMPLSQATSWYLLAKAMSNKDGNDDKVALYGTLWKLAAFYCSWALLNRFRGNKKEMGHISMGLTALATYFELPKIFTIPAIGLVLANFVAPAKTVMIDLDIAELARKTKNTTTWAYVFKGYFVSSMALWSTVLYQVIAVKE